MFIYLLFSITWQQISILICTYLVNKINLSYASFLRTLLYYKYTQLFLSIHFYYCYWIYITNLVTTCYIICVRISVVLFHYFFPFLNYCNFKTHIKSIESGITWIKVGVLSHVYNCRYLILLFILIFRQPAIYNSSIGHSLKVRCPV